MILQGREGALKIEEIPYSWAREELHLDRSYGRGDKGPRVKIIQEWLCLRRQQTRPDSDFGPATEYAVRQFQLTQGIPETGIVDEATFRSLTSPMLRALSPLEVGSRGFNEMIVAYAQQHLAAHPMEVGGENCGPWVRLYMKGNQGSSWPWCAGFVSFILQQAADSLKIAMPFNPSFSCDTLGREAESKGLLVTEENLERGAPAKSEMLPGSVFLRRHGSFQWEHTGLVIEFAEEIFKTLEGNTNDDGSSEGYEVVKRVHGYPGKDFIRIA